MNVVKNNIKRSPGIYSVKAVFFKINCIQFFLHIHIFFVFLLLSLFFYYFHFTCNADNLGLVHRAESRKDS